MSYFKNRNLKNLLILFLALLGLVFGTSILTHLNINALNRGATPADDCGPPFYIPNACKTSFKPDLNCTANKFTNPQDKCCPNACPGAGVDVDKQSTTYRKLIIFGTEFRLDPDKIPGLIKLLFQTFLGITSIFALVRGIYLAGFKRTMTTEPGEIAKLNKELTNMIVGFAICWGFILIVQFVSNFLGLGDLGALQIDGASGVNIVTVK